MDEDEDDLVDGEDGEEEAAPGKRARAFRGPGVENQNLLNSRLKGGKQVGFLLLYCIHALGACTSPVASPYPCIYILNQHPSPPSTTPHSPLGVACQPPACRIYSSSLAASRTQLTIFFSYPT